MFPCSSIRRSDISLSAWVLAPNIQNDWSFHSCWSCLPPHNPKVARNQIYTAKLTEDNKFAQPSSYENLTFFMATVFPVSRHLSNQIQHLLIPTCGFVGFLPFFVICFFSSQKIFIQNQIDHQKNLSVKKKQSPNRKSDNWSACIGKPLHRILPRSYLTFGTSHVDLPQVLKRRSKSKRLPGKTSKFEVLTIGVPAPRAPTGFEPKHCKRWNTEVIKFRQKKKKRTRKKAVHCSMTENPLCIHTRHKSCRSIHFCPRVRFCVNLQGPQSHKACQQILSCGSGSSGARIGETYIAAA